MHDDNTVPHILEPNTLDGGVALVMAAEDGGDWRAVIDWLARNPGKAGQLAGFLATQRGLKAVVAPLTGGPCIPGLELCEEIGRGAMGVVYRAHQPALNRDVAVKIVPAVGAADRARFRFEAEAAAQLDDPHVLPVLEFGEADGVPYLVLPFVPGGSLARWVRERDRALPPDLAAEILRGIALGTHHAHQHGLIHRDLKPGNVLMDAADRPRIADFGLARPVDATVTGIAGTLAYMAPEQARGDKRLTTAVDVHALGVILFELLTGTTPYGGDNFAAVLRRIEEEPPRPLRLLRGDVPADLEAICRRCLEKRPEDRYPTALAVAEDLGHYLAGEPLTGPPTRGLGDDLRRAMSRLVPTRGFGVRSVLFLGALSSTLSLAGLQLAVLLDAPLWGGWLALACYYLGWLTILLVIAVRHRHALNTVERFALASHFGMLAAALGILPTQLWLHRGDVVPVVAPLLAIIGLGVFVSGGIFWGRLYLVGLFEFVLAALLPLVPLSWWPGLFCLNQLALQLGLGWLVWRIDREGRRAP